jgi:CheY-like chemotaxis protein
MCQSACLGRRVLVIDGKGTFLSSYQSTLAERGLSVIGASSGDEAMMRVAHDGIDLILLTRDIPDLPGILLLRRLHRMRAAVPIVMVDADFRPQDVVAAVRLGAVDFVDGRVAVEQLTLTVERALGSNVEDSSAGALSLSSAEYAAARWARAVVAVIDAPRDPRIFAGWSGMVFVSIGVLRQWCRRVGIRPRRALVFVRLLRATYLKGKAGHNLANVLDITDRRTLDGLLTYAGLSREQELPSGTAEFLERQSLVGDVELLAHVRRTVLDRRWLQQSVRGRGCQNGRMAPRKRAAGASQPWPSSSLGEHLPAPRRREA